MPLKRPLTESEISFILEDVGQHVPQFLPDNLSKGYLEKIRSPLETQLRRTEVVDHPDVVDMLKKRIHDSIRRSIVQAGEGVGVICAQSIGERQTQLTLNSFHQSGLCVATVVTGVPRFLELLNATKDPKMSSNRFSLSVNLRTPQKMRDMLKHHLVHLSFSDLVVRDTVHLEKEEEVWYGAYETVYSNQFRDYHACLSFELDLKKMHQYKITPVMVREKLEAQFSDLCCVFSPLHIGQFDVFVDISQVTLPEAASKPAFLNSSNYIHIFLEDIVKVKLLEVKICGLTGVQNYHILKGEGNSFHAETEGSNLDGLVALPFVDIGTVRSNNMWDIYHVMGIEATREFLIEEFTSIVSSDGTFLNPVHILLLVDIMTHHGTINSVSRYGLKKEQVGVLSRSSFEESLDHFCNAGFYAEKEPVKAVSAAIMCGKRSKIGSGLCSLLMDWKTINEKSARTLH
jgi:DNA-directed RNA polymerase beta' subunit